MRISVNCLHSDVVFLSLVFPSQINTVQFVFLLSAACSMFGYFCSQSLCGFSQCDSLSAASTMKLQNAKPFPLLSLWKTMALGRIGPCGCYFLLTCYGQELKTLSRSEAVLQLTVTVAVTSFYAVTPFPPVVLQDGTIRTTRASFCLIAKLAETQTASWRGIKHSLSIRHFHMLSQKHACVIAIFQSKLLQQ